MDARQTVEVLLEGNRRFVNGNLRQRNPVRRRAELLDGQKPCATVLSCSDSRVVPAYLFDTGLGDLFTVAAAGNVADEVALGSIEYGVAVLHTPVLLILGHTRCAAVTAACEDPGGGRGHMASVIKRIRPAAEKRQRIVEWAIEENVHLQMEQILRHSEAVRGEVAAGRLMPVAALYSLETGEVRVLD